jgi:putative ABC transport system ATP-binding protein
LSAIVARDLEQSYMSGGRPLTVLQDIHLSIEPREIVAIVGPSGSGKTTLLGLLAGLDLPSRGSVALGGVSLNELSEDERASLRARTVGFVFQTFQLLPTLTALENVRVPLELLPPGAKRPAAHAMEARARALLERVGLGARVDHYPAQLSGGEQQRVAVARAFVHEPSILLADEPTGNLDAETGRQIIELLLDLNRDAGTTLVLVTHDLELAARAARVVRMAGGRIASDTRSADLRSSAGAGPAERGPTQPWAARSGGADR